MSDQAWGVLIFCCVMGTYAAIVGMIVKIG